MKFNREMLSLYGITDRAFAGEMTLMEQIEEAIKGGTTIIQLREKNLNKEAFIQEAIEAKALCAKYNVPLIINDDPEVAIKAGADGVHVGIEDTPVSQIRKNAPEGFIIGATCKTVEQALKAKAEGADYMGVGAVFPSPTKKNAVRITLDQLNEICTSVDIPAVAIGGITLENIRELSGAEVAGFAVISALFGAKDIQAAAKELKSAAKAIVE